jgi:hypothetical protein
MIPGERQDIVRLDFSAGKFPLNMPDASSPESSEEPYIIINGK